MHWDEQKRCPRDFFGGDIWHFVLESHCFWRGKYSISIRILIFFSPTRGTRVFEIFQLLYTNEIWQKYDVVQNQRFPSRYKMQVHNKRCQIPQILKHLFCLSQCVESPWFFVNLVLYIPYVNSEIKLTPQMCDLRGRRKELMRRTSWKWGVILWFERVTWNDA